MKIKIIKNANGYYKVLIKGWIFWEDMYDELPTLSNAEEVVNAEIHLYNLNKGYQTIKEVEV